MFQFIFRFHGVANTTDSNPSWTVTSNPNHPYSLGTFQERDLSNPAFYFTTYLFKTSSPIASIARYQKAADENCTIADETLKIVFPTLSDAYYFYVLSGAFCADNGLFKITHLNASNEQLEEVNTITAVGFPANEQLNDGSPRAVPPPSNFGKADVVMPFYTPGSTVVSVARAAVKLKDNGIPLEINITRADYDFQLQQKNRTFESYDLSTLHNNSLVQWSYLPSNLAVGVLPFGSKSILLNIYSANSKRVQNQVDLPESDEELLYDMSLHPYNSTAFLLYNRILNPNQSPYPFVFLLHVLSIDGRLEFLGSKPSNGISSLVALQQDHGDFLQGGVFSVENTADASRPNLTYFHHQRQDSFLLPDSPWWLLESWSDGNALVESSDGLLLVEMQKLETPGFELGGYVLPCRNNTPTSTSTGLMSTGLISNSRSTFFQSATNTNGVANYALAIGLSVGFLVLIASSIAACFYLCCRKKPYQELKEEVNYSV